MNADPAFTPIGAVRCAFARRQGFPIGGCDADLEILPAFLPALDGLESSTHLLVLGFLHHADRSVLRARPRKVDARAQERGVLATRSPDRPNPISVTVVPFIGREGPLLHVARLDLLDGTPLLDVKPYVPGWDGIYAARHALRSRPDTLDDAALVEILQRDLENHLGGAASRSVGARRILMAGFLACRELSRDLRDADLRVEVNRADVSVDALMGLSGAAFHDGRLACLPGSGPLCVRFRAQGRRLVLVELPGADAVLASPAFRPREVFSVAVEAEASR